MTCSFRKRVGGLQSDRLEFRVDFVTFQNERQGRSTNREVFQLVDHGPVQPEDQGPLMKKQKIDGGIGLKLMQKMGKMMSTTR